jgi:kynurenine formamidase
MAGLPRYDDLPELPGLGLRHAWDVFGRDDRLGTINLLDRERVLAAVGLVRTGEVVSLDLRLDLPDPPLFGRKPYRHHVFALNRNEMDDRLDDFHLQGSTQWDALGHVRCREHGFWGGRTTDPSSEHNDLGIEQWAEHGIVGRGVLLDVAAWAAGAGRPFDALAGVEITATDLQAVLDQQGAILRPGDVLCLRTGWVGAYTALDAAARVTYADAPTFAGLRADEATARFLWDAHVAAVVCDNPAVEVVPGDPTVGSLHRRLLPLLGLALGEMFDLEALARRCRERRQWDFLFVAVPLKVPGGIGSPGNAVAIL